MPTNYKKKYSHKSSWKDAQQRINTKNKSKLALAVLALVIGILVLSWAVNFTKSLFSPFRQTSLSQKKIIWDGEFNINLLIRTDQISLLSYNPKEGRITIIDIPDETFLIVPYDFGMWQLRAVYGLGESQKELGGGRLLKDTLTSFFALPLDGFLDLSTLKPKKSAYEVVEQLRENLFSGLDFLSALQTDLTPLELIKLKMSINNVRFDKTSKIDLVELNALSKESLSDGTQVYTADPFKLDAAIAGLADPAVVSEHKTIAVFNATDKAQLAQKWARLITNLGGNVIITTNAKKKLKNTQVTGEQSHTFKRLRQIFELDCQENPKCDRLSASDEDLLSSRAQINLFLGEDYLTR